MPRICETPFAALDFESTGAGRGAEDQPVQVGVVVLENWAPQWNLLFVSRIASEIAVRPPAFRLHGLPAASSADAPSLLELWPELSSRLSGRWLLAHGAGTERRFLRAFPLHGFGPWVDTLKLARALDPERPSHALGDLARDYGLEPALKKLFPGFRWHDALCDAAACLLLFQHLIASHDLLHREVTDLLRLDDSPYHQWKARSR